MGMSITNIARRFGWLKGSIRIWLLYAILCVLGLCQFGCAYAQLKGATINDRPAIRGESLGIEITREGEQMTPELGLDLQKGDEIKTSPGVTALIKFSDGSEIIMMPDTHITIESVRVWFGKVIATIKGAFKVKTEYATGNPGGTVFVMYVDRNGQSLVTMIEGSLNLKSNTALWSLSLQSGQEASILSSEEPEIIIISRERYNNLVQFINKTKQSIKGTNVPVLVPKVIGLYHVENEVQRVLDFAGLRVGKVIKTISDDYLNGDYGIGMVVDQQPGHGKEIKRGGSVDITVRVRDVTVPNVIGQPRRDAMGALQESGLSVDGYVQEKMTGRYEPGVVNAQSPNAGQRVIEGTTVKLTVEAVYTEVPKVTGMSVTQAESLIREIGLAVRTRPSGLIENIEVEGPYVVGQEPTAGTHVKPGSVMTINVANPGVRVPNLIGRYEREVQNLLNRANLRVGNISRQHHEKYPVGVVIDQSPTTGKVIKPGSTVAITVSTGLPKTWVPNLIGQNEKEAMNLLIHANLRVGRISRQESGRYRVGIVMEQSPTAGQSVRPGSTVDFTVSEGLR